MTTPAIIKSLLPVLQAYAEGEELQVSDNDNYPWRDIKILSANDLCVALAHGTKYLRIKPKPTWRDWKTEEAPRIFVARSKLNGNELIVYRHDEAYHCPFRLGNGIRVSALVLLANFVRVLEDGTTTPCGVMEQP